MRRRSFFLEIGEALLGFRLPQLRFDRIHLRVQRGDLLFRRHVLDDKRDASGKIFNLVALLLEHRGDVVEQRLFGHARSIRQAWLCAT